MARSAICGGATDFIPSRASLRRCPEGTTRGGSGFRFRLGSVDEWTDPLNWSVTQGSADPTPLSLRRGDPLHEFASTASLSPGRRKGDHIPSPPSWPPTAATGVLFERGGSDHQGGRPGFSRNGASSCAAARPTRSRPGFRATEHPSNPTSSRVDCPRETIR